MRKKLIAKLVRRYNTNIRWAGRDDISKVTPRHFNPYGTATLRMLDHL